MTNRKNEKKKKNVEMKNYRSWIERKGKKWYKVHKKTVSLPGLAANVLDCDTIGREILLRYYVHFRTNILGKLISSTTI